MKTFLGDFEKIKNYLIDGINFSFTRFSDGELFVLTKQKIRTK
jgi:hypothetical protein